MMAIATTKGLSHDLRLFGESTEFGIYLLKRDPIAETITPTRRPVLIEYLQLS